MKTDQFQSQDEEPPSHGNGDIADAHAQGAILLLRWFILFVFFKLSSLVVDVSSHAVYPYLRVMSVLQIRRKAMWTKRVASLLGWMWIIVGIAACAPVQLTPVSSPQVAPTIAAPKAITISFFEEPDSLNFMYSQMWFATLAMDLIQRGLWIYDDRQSFVPELAVEIPSRENGGISEDGKVVTIRLRRGVRWHDGEPVTSADVKFTYDAIMNPKNTVDTRYPYEDYIESIETPDEETIIIHSDRSLCQLPGTGGAATDSQLGQHVGGRATVSGDGTMVMAFP